MDQQSKMRKLISRIGLLLLLIFLSLYGATSLLADDDDDEETFDTVPGQIVVKLAAGLKIGQFNLQYGTTTLDVLVSDRPIYLLAAPDGTNVDALIRRINRNRRVLYAEPNFYLEQPEIDRRSAWGWGGQDSAPYDEQYARELINLEGAHALGRGAGVVVAVVDTGVQLDHPALAGGLTAARLDLIDGDNNPDDVGNGIDDDGDGEIDEGTGHGTHVAGIVRLAAPDARVMPIRALDSDGRGGAFAIAEAIQFALANGAAVINLSLGMAAESEVVEEVTQNAAEEDVLIFAAAGNLNSDVPQYPAADECVLAVSSVGPGGVRSAFANFGSWIALVAPGESVYSPFPVDGYAWWSGSSMATPFASGLAALIIGNDPSLSAYAAAEYMGATARSVNDVNPDFQSKLGAGLIDAEAALVALSQGQPPTSYELLPDECAPDGQDNDEDDDD